MIKAALAATALLALPAAAAAQDAQPDYAVGFDVAFSTDADDTEVLRYGINADPVYHGPDDYVGVRLEQVRFRPNGTAGENDERVYLRVAKPVGDWQLRAQVGTDGETLVGALAVHNNDPLRLEAFVERDKLETPQGIAQDLYSTFGGAAVDLPLGERAQVTLLGGLQDFDGDNLRKHARANLIYVVKPDWGLSAQLRTRYFHNSVPQEVDYYSPESFVEILPVLQVRRFSGGWQYLAAGGWGAQKDSRSDWRSSRYVNLRVIGPADRKGWSVKGDLIYSNQPITNSSAYDYLRITTGVTRAF